MVHVAVNKYDFEKINILEYAFGEGGGGHQKAYAVYAFINVDNCERPLNGFRYTTFEKAFGPNATVKNHLHKGVDASSLMPCEAELQEHNIFIGLHLWRRCRLVPISKPYTCI